MKMPEYRVHLVRALRTDQTESEARLWEHLRGRRLAGLKFRRQRPIGRYVADFCCDERSLIVEIDGSIHDESNQREYDAARNAWLAAAGYQIIHVTPAQVMTDMATVLAFIREASLAPLYPAKNERGRERGWG